ncbi:hypothetical protein PG990_008368 [Apiospora arundinis]
MRDLLLLQRVSIAFRDVIRSSTPIQQKLFLAPVAQGTTVSGQETVPNPLLMDIFHPLYDDVLPFGPAVRADMVTSLRASPGRGLPLGSAAKVKQRKEEALNRRGASWRSMLLSQPPPRRLKYTNRVQKRDARLVVIARDAPVRMGAVYDLAYFALWRTGAVRVRWQFYAQFFDERGLPLLHDTTGLETPPGRHGVSGHLRRGERGVRVGRGGAAPRPARAEMERKRSRQADAAGAQNVAAHQGRA